MAEAQDYSEQLFHNNHHISYEALLDQFPEVADELRQNVEKYGSPILKGGLGGLTPYGLAGHVSDLLDGPGIYNALEINIRPVDTDSNHYELNWYVLTDQDRQFRRAIEVEKERNGDMNGNGLRNSQ